MEIKTTNTVDKAIAYLTKTSNHLFVTAEGYMYKIETFEHGGKQYYAKFIMGKGKSIIQVSELDKQFGWYGSNTLNVIQNELFPVYFKTQSIPYFKKMRAAIEEVMSEISIDNNVNKKLAEKLLVKVNEM